jgi:hypothetical protein
MRQQRRNTCQQDNRCRRSRRKPPWRQNIYQHRSQCSRWNLWLSCTSQRGRQCTRHQLPCIQDRTDTRWLQKLKSSTRRIRCTPASLVGRNICQLRKGCKPRNQRSPCRIPQNTLSKHRPAQYSPHRKSTRWSLPTNQHSIHKNGSLQTRR